MSPPRLARQVMRRYGRVSTMVRRLVAVVMLGVLAGCAREPVQYESRYVEPPKPNTAAALTSARPADPRVLPVAASFFDDFERADTTSGLGDEWMMSGDVMRGQRPSAATDGFIRDGRYTSAGTSVVYAARDMRGTVTQMGTVGRFRQSADGSDSSLGMGISPDDQLTANGIVFTASRWGWQVRLRRASAFQPVVMRGDFVPPLEIDTDYQFSLNITGGDVSVDVPGSHVSREAPVSGLIGSHTYWMLYIQKPPAKYIFNFDAVWADEAGQALSEIGPQALIGKS